MGACAFTGIQQRDVIVVKKTPFSSLSTRVQQNGVSKHLHSGERLWKDAFSVIIFTGYVKCGQQTKPGEKNSFVLNQKRIPVDGA